MGHESGAVRSSGRIFVSYAAMVAVPVLLLAIVLASTYRSEADRRGLAEGRSEAILIAQTAVQPLLSDQPVTMRIRGREWTDLMRLVQQSVRTKEILRLRIRNLNGDVVFADDDSGFKEGADDEALEAAHGETVARLTYLNADAADANQRFNLGPQAVEVYIPLLESAPPQLRLLHLDLPTATIRIALFQGAPRRVGVLELYLPYAPIRADVTTGLRGLYLALAAGLAALYVVLLLISLSVTRRLREQVSENAYLAEHDRLTGLPNRSVFRKRVIDFSAANAAAGRATTVAVIDLDNFRDVNDTLGHENGDRLLVAIARRLAAHFGSDGAVSHLSGDEFGLVLNGADAVVELEEARRMIGREIEVVGVPISVEASVGYVTAPVGISVNVDALLQHADVAMYQAKARHSRVARYEAAEDHFDAANLEIIAGLRRAIEGGELVLHYQPQLSVLSGRVDAVEALVRWQHPTRGLLGPDHFIPLAERTDLIERLTEWVIGRSLAEIGSLGPNGDCLGLSVNVSARSLSGPDFARQVLSALGDSAITPDRLTIEITETVLLADPLTARTVLAELAATGISISLDDFGTGQTSLSYLSSLPVHELKVDKGFVLGMLDDHSQAAIVRSIVDLGHNLGLAVVAEGVETSEILGALEDIGCDRAQGYLFARPMPLAQLSEWIDHERFTALASADRAARRGAN